MHYNSVAITFRARLFKEQRSRPLHGCKFHWFLTRTCLHLSSTRAGGSLVPTIFFMSPSSWHTQVICADHGLWTLFVNTFCRRWSPISTRERLASCHRGAKDPHGHGNYPSSLLVIKIKQISRPITVSLAATNPCVAVIQLQGTQHDPSLLVLKYKQIRPPPCNPCPKAATNPCSLL